MHSEHPAENPIYTRESMVFAVSWCLAIRELQIAAVMDVQKPYIYA